MTKALKTILLVTIILIVNCEKEIPEDLHYLSKKEETVHLTKAPANSYLVMQFYNCENRNIDFNLEIGDIKNEYSFTEDVKFLYFPIENENIPKLHLKNNYEKLLRYSYSSENIFSFTPVLDKKIRATVNGRNIYFTFRNFALDVQNEYLILLVKNHNPKKIHDLTSQLNTSNLELNELKNKSTSVSLDQMLENPNLALEEQLDESKKTIEKLNEEIKYYEKQMVKAKKNEELEAKLKFCEDTIETMKNHNNELKEQKKKAQDDFEKELEKVNLELNVTKCELAKVNFDKDLIATESQRYINKLKNKMISLGFKFKTKKG